MSQFLVIFNLKNAKPPRLITMIPQLESLLKGLSKQPIEIAFRSATADIYGYGLVSEMNASQLKAAIESPGRSRFSDKEPVLEGDDRLMILELGKDFHAGEGFTRFGTWLQRHR